MNNKPKSETDNLDDAARDYSLVILRQNGVDMECVGPDSVSAFKAGAEWQKQQMMKDALNCSIIMHPNDRLANYSISAYVPPLHPASTYISNGDKVKIIVIKED